MKVILRFFKCMESMARDMRHPYIPSTTVLGDIRLSDIRTNQLMQGDIEMSETRGCLRTPLFIIVREGHATSCFPSCFTSLRFQEITQGLRFTIVEVNQNQNTV